MRPGTGGSGPRQEVAQDRASALLRVGSLLWPEPLQVTLGRPPAAGAVRHRYLPLPGAADPRRVVPVRPRRAAAAAVLRSGSDESLSARGQSLVLGGSLALGLGQLLLRDRLTISAAADVEGIEEHLAGVFGRPVSLSLRLGPPRANLKPVLEVLDGRGHSLGHAKVGVNALTARLVAHERRALEELAACRPVATSAPAVLGYEDWRGLSVLVLSSLPVGMVRRKPGPDLVTRSMLEVARGAGTSELPLERSAFAEALQARVDALKGDAWGELLVEPVLATLDTLADRTFTFGRWHGDWHPGNMATGRDGRLLLWDWERSADDVPVGLDALHLLLHTGVLRGLPPEESVRRLCATGPGTVAVFGIDHRTAEDVVRLYCAEILVRYTEDRQWTIPWAHELMQQLLASLRSWKGSPCH